MRVAILETIIMPAGHEVEFDRILVEELKRQGHEPVFFVPEKFPFKLDYKTEISYLSGGEVVTYAGVGRLKKLYLSLIREKRRRAWFNAAYEKAKAGEVDAIIIPTGTYRYIRAIGDSKLKDSPVPVYMIFHGINPGEKPKFEKQARKIEPFKNIQLRVITLRNDFKNSGLSNVKLILPPVFKPMKTKVQEELSFSEPLTLGFFGQFRKEKNLEFFLEAFIKANFEKPVNLLVQGATAKPEDGELFEAIAEKFKSYQNISFLHKSLIGDEWEEALLKVDALVIPYAAERYRYHWGAMLYTAIGFFKPVLVSPELNPEVLEQYRIGKVVDMKSLENLTHILEEFIFQLHNEKESYEEQLKAANKAYSHENLVKSILD